MLIDIKKHKLSLIQALLFWTGILFVSLAIYLYVMAAVNLMNIKEANDSELDIIVSDHDYKFHIQHEFSNNDKNNLFGVSQYPQGSLVAHYGSFPFYLNNSQTKVTIIASAYLKNKSTSRSPLSHGSALKQQTTLFFCCDRVYLSPIRLELYPLTLGVALLIWPIIGIIKRRNSRELTSA